jgi:hypothetical protein
MKKNNRFSISILSIPYNIVVTIERCEFVINLEVGSRSDTWEQQ